jgi:hypothetical protein
LLFAPVFASVVLLGASVVGLAVVVAQTGDPEPEEPAIPAPERYAEAEGRYQAALADQVQEATRIEEATASYAAAHGTAPGEDRNYMVSFAQPVRALSLLQAWQKDRVCCPLGMQQLDAVFTWVLADDGIHPIIGEHLDEDIGLAGPPEDADSRLQSLLLDYLERRSEAITDALGQENEGDDLEALSAQASENAALQASVTERGVFLHGMRCQCSPAFLDALTTDLPGVVFRAVEAVELGYQFPIAPTDPLRQRIIETGGRYGR